MLILFLLKQITQMVLKIYTYHLVLKDSNPYQIGPTFINHLKKHIFIHLSIILALQI